MVAYVRDTTGRFAQRPYFRPEELDRDCETLITGFLEELHGKVEYPVATDDLTRLIERDAQNLDLYADLSSYGDDVEGVTEFTRGCKPRVLIAMQLTENTRQENRLRTTLTHEYGHVHFHGSLWDVEPQRRDLLRPQPHPDKVICKRESMIDAAEVDWMEWQAGYVCGAILMPKTVVLTICRDYVEAHDLYGAVSLQSTHAQALIGRVVEGFQVSRDAARVRLLKLGLLTAAAPTQSLFG